MLLEGNFPDDLKRMSASDRKQLAREIRETLVETVMNNGGHLASNLGAVELTIALHSVFDSPRDRILFDVGHQAYVHKLLTGRADRFNTLRRKDGLNGFPNSHESEHDSFTAGHASTALSAALGIARARDIRGEDYSVVTVIGDGALTGGMCYEALNDAGQTETRMIVVLNDNEMSISRNVGALSEHLAGLRQSSSYVHAKNAVRTALERLPVLGGPLVRFLTRLRDTIKALLVGDHFFEALGFSYSGPIDGHDIDRLIRALNTAKRSSRPVVLHVVTRKGMGFEPAESRPDDFHGLSPRKQPGAAACPCLLSSGDEAAKCLVEMAQTDPRVCVAVAAMPSGTGMERFARAYPKRFFDVGIAEEHTVEMAAGLAFGGMRPYVAVYSTFLQRAYDQMLMDVCLPELPVVFLIDRAGLVGEDGATHQGLYDLTWLRSMPGMRIAAPSCISDLRDLLRLSTQSDGRMAIRYPKVLPEALDAERREAISLDRGTILREGKDVAIVAVGPCVSQALLAAQALEAQGVRAAVADARFIKPLDTALLARLAGGRKLLVTVEENTLCGGFGSAVAEWIASSGTSIRLVTLGVPDVFVRHATILQQRESTGCDAAGITARILNEMHKVKHL